MRNRPEREPDANFASTGQHPRRNPLPAAPRYPARSDAAGEGSLYVHTRRVSAVDQQLLAYARQLEETDAALAQAIREAAELERETQELAAKARAATGLLARLPAARAAAETAVADARAERERRQRAADEAHARFERSERRGKAEEIADARRAVVRTGDELRTAEDRLTRAVAARERVERDAEAVTRDVPRLEQAARKLAERFAALPRVAQRAGEAPAAGLDGTESWAARAHAAVFVARSGLETERERVVREANELGAAALGEPVAATSVALVRRRLEQA